MKLLFCGDIVIEDPLRFKISTTLQDVISSHDIKCCNLEAPVVDDAMHRSKLIKAGPVIHQTSESLQLLSEVGFNLVTLANNHIMDYGAFGLKKTHNACVHYKMRAIGAGFSFEHAYTPHVIVDEQNRRIAILNYGEAGFGALISRGGGYAWINHINTVNTVNKVSKSCDVTIVVCHGGLEGVDTPLPEWQNCYRKLVDSGADVVIAHHPHIVQGIETYKEKKIFYSLGNFYFDNQYNIGNIEWNRSIIVSIDSNMQDLVKFYPVQVTDNCIDISTSKSFYNDIHDRSSYLTDRTKLEKRANELADDLWARYYEEYWLSLTHRTDSIMRMLKYVAKKVIFRNRLRFDKIDETMLLHNLQIESHRWLCERYLHNKNIENNEHVLIND